MHSYVAPRPMLKEAFGLQPAVMNVYVFFAPTLLLFLCFQFRDSFRNNCIKSIPLTPNINI